ncbi:MAG: RNA polymerase sigma-70 factor [Niabella sp.]
MELRNTEHLIDLIAEKDDQLAFNKLYEHFFPGLFSFAFSILKNRENAEEIILDVFLRLWENRKTMKTIKKLSNYLYVATKHACISFLRKKNIISYGIVEENALYTIVSPEQKIISKQTIDVFNRLINALPAKCKLIFRLIKEEKLSYEEVAHLLGISKKTVEAQMYIANKKLISGFKQALPELSSVVFKKEKKN